MKLLGRITEGQVAEDEDGFRFFVTQCCAAFTYRRVVGRRPQTQCRGCHKTVPALPTINPPYGESLTRRTDFQAVQD